MAHVTYSISYGVAKKLRRLHGDLDAIRRLEDLKGTEDDLRWVIDQLVEDTSLAAYVEVLRSTLAHDVAARATAQRLAEKRLEMHCNDVADALPDSPGEALVVLSTVMSSVLLAVREETGRDMTEPVIGAVRAGFQAAQK